LVHGGAFLFEPLLAGSEYYGVFTVRSPFTVDECEPKKVEGVFYLWQNAQSTLFCSFL